MASFHRCTRLGPLPIVHPSLSHSRLRCTIPLYGSSPYSILSVNEKNTCSFGLQGKEAARSRLATGKIVPAGTWQSRARAEKTIKCTRVEPDIGKNGAAATR